jgi:Flp pilus assembly protein TadB
MKRKTKGLFGRSQRANLSVVELSSRRKRNIFKVVFSLLIAGLIFIFSGNSGLNLIILTIGSFALAYFGAFMIFRFIDSLKASARIRKIELAFPDFLQSVSSNLRAGMTVDRAMLLSSRPEFAPLDKEILQVGKDISTGKPVELSLRNMSDRINSEKINKTLLIILSGIRAGGNLAILLDETASNMRQRGFVEKKAASQVSMYVIFIFLAVSIFAPALFSLSGVLVGTMTNLLGDVNVEDLPQNLPVSFNAINISETFVFYFSLTFIIVMDIMASCVLGLVGKGEEKEGLRYLPIMLFLSLSVFLIIGRVLEKVMGNLVV